MYSAGIEIHGLNPKAVQTMKDDGIDISGQTSNSIDEYEDMEFDMVITVCDHAKESCPYFPFKTNIFHQNFQDPSKFVGTEDEVNQEFAKTRNQIKSYCKKLIEEKR